MLKNEIKTVKGIGSVLFLTDGKTQIGIALDVGIRIVHLSAFGMENIMYNQPEDLSDGIFTKSGWRVYGGHRLWFAPESPKSTSPDNEKIEYCSSGNTFTFTQKEDKLLGVIKEVSLSFSDDGKIKITHRIQNTSDEILKGSVWGISTLSSGGVAVADFEGTPPGHFGPQRSVAVWRDTDLSDERMKFFEDRVEFRHKETDRFFKVGLYSRNCHIKYENKGQRFDIKAESFPMESLSDMGSNIEVFLNRYTMEIETLGPCVLIKKGETAEFSEIWSVEKI